MKRKIYLGIIIMAMLITISNYNYAAIEIVQSKDKGTDSIINTNISNSYLLCQGMTNQGESLEGTSLKPHLATNKDWGAVTYLANSMYGTNTAGKNTGVEIMIDGVKYYSTTGNETGVMNWGSNPNVTRFTQTAGIINTYENNTSTAKDNVVEIFKNKDTIFVEKIKTEAFTSQNTLGMAMGETRGMYSSWAGAAQDSNYPISIRNGLFGFIVGSVNFGNVGASGAPHSQVTFRPVIWN